MSLAELLFWEGQGDVTVQVEQIYWLKNYFIYDNKFVENRPSKYSSIKRSERF